MFEAARKHLRSIAMLAVAGALVVGGVAAAQGNSEAGSRSGAPNERFGGPPPGPPVMAMAMPGLTYGELHIRNDEGKEETVRIDQGKIKSVDSSSIVLTENDESEVTIKVDSNTHVMDKPGEESSLEDLEAGQQVSVSGPAGGPAKAIMVMPKKGDFAAAFRGGPMPPPPGVQYGVQSWSSRGPSGQSSGAQSSSK
jgi:Domain of unknown function (DUF5666)